MKKLSLVFSAMAVAFATAAGAADLPVKAPPPAPVGKHAVPLAAWTGPYVGVHVGWGQYDAKDTSFLPPLLQGLGLNYNGEFDGDGWLGGVQIGYDHQWGNFVLGLVADYSWSGMDGQKNIVPFGGGPTIVSVSHEIESFGTARLRAGLAWNQSLWYVTGGAAYAQTKANLSGLLLGGLSAGADTDRVGWAYGVGAEWRFASNWSFGVEWLRLDFGTDTVSFSTPLLGGIALGVPVDLDADIIRANFNYRF